MPPPHCPSSSILTSSNRIRLHPASSVCTLLYAPQFMLQVAVFSRLGYLQYSQDPYCRAPQTLGISFSDAGCQLRGQGTNTQNSSGKLAIFLPRAHGITGRFRGDPYPGTEITVRCIECQPSELYNPASYPKVCYFPGFTIAVALGYPQGIRTLSVCVYWSLIFCWLIGIQFEFQRVSGCSLLLWNPSAVESFSLSQIGLQSSRLSTLAGWNYQVSWECHVKSPIYWRVGQSLREGIIIDESEVKARVASYQAYPCSGG